MSWQPASTTCSNASLDTSYSYISEIPSSVTSNAGVECILGVDEAGRGPVLGPMVYGVSYCSVNYAEQIKSHGFMDSKVLDHETRVDLLHKISDPTHELFEHIGWTVRVMSARDIGAGMLRPIAPYNLNAQAHDTTIQLIRDVLNQGVNVRKIFVDTVGIAETYQARLQREFPMAEVTVCKKADSIYPIVSVASICAKVTRDKALVLAVPSEDQSAIDVEADKEDKHADKNKGSKFVESAPKSKKRKNEFDSDVSDEVNIATLYKDESSINAPSIGSWGSGYPSDARTTAWLKSHIHPIFGWRGSMVRYSWSTTRELLKGSGKSDKNKGSKDAVDVDWHENSTEDGQQMLSFDGASKKEGYTIANWYGSNVGVKGFKI